MDPHRLRQALVAHFDQKLTPEVATAIFTSAFADDGPTQPPVKFGVEQFGDYRIAAERLQDVLPDLLPLHALHWAETEKHRHCRPLEPDYDAMLADECAGRLIQITARHHGAIVGHLRAYVRDSRHTRTPYAEEDTLFVHPEHRGGFLAVRMVRFWEQAMAAVGVFEMRANTKHVNRVDVLMKRLDYQPVATQFVKFLEK